MAEKRVRKSRSALPPGEVIRQPWHTESGRLDSETEAWAREQMAGLHPTLPHEPVCHFVYELRHVSGGWHPETAGALANGLSPDTFYVGKSSTDRTVSYRFRRHINTAILGKHACHRCHVIRQMLRARQLPIFKIVEIFETEEEAFRAEAARSKAYPAGRLTNAREGGLTGWRPSMETRRKISESNKGKIPPEHVRAAALRAVTGRVKTADEIERIRATMKQRPFTEEHKANMRAHHITKGPEGDAWREKLREIFIGKHTKLTAEGEEQVVMMRLAGRTCLEIGAVVGLSYGHVAEVIQGLIREGRLPKPESTAERLARAAAIYNAGGGADDVARSLGLIGRSGGYSAIRRAEQAGLITAKSIRLPHEDYSLDAIPRVSGPMARGRKQVKSD